MRREDFEQEAQALKDECKERIEAREWARKEAEWLMSRAPGYSRRMASKRKLKGWGFK